MPCTCQICGRETKAKHGLIAHHGYKRPNRGSGWQTSSCFGARYRPYEVACDALPLAIASITAYIATTEATLATWLASPPNGILRPKRGFYDARYPVSVLKPANFDPSQSTHMPESYSSLYSQTKYSLMSLIKYAKEDLKFMEKRLADWRYIG